MKKNKFLITNYNYNFIFAFFYFLKFKNSMQRFFFQKFFFFFKNFNLFFQKYLNLNIYFYIFLKINYKSSLFFIKPFFLFLKNFYSFNSKHIILPNSNNFIFSKLTELNETLKNLFFLNYKSYSTNYIFNGTSVVFNNFFYYSYYNVYKSIFYKLFIYSIYIYSI
jgi:hypothetical protein